MVFKFDMENFYTRWGNEYSIERVPPDDFISGFILHGKRKAEYSLIRNVPNPRLMFAISSKGSTKTPFEGMWFVEYEGLLYLLHDGVVGWEDEKPDDEMEKEIINYARGK